MIRFIDWHDLAVYLFLNYLSDPFKIPEGSIFKRQVYPGWCIHNSPGITESEKTFMPVVLPQSAVSHASKRQVMVADMHKRIIDAGTTGGCFQQNIFGFTALPEVVKCGLMMRGKYLLCRISGPNIF